MRVTVINGTKNKGCTHAMKQVFMETLGKGHEVTEFYLPEDLPVFCTGCKACFHKDITACPNSEYTNPIWKSIKESELIVITSPVYVFHATAQIKSLLDHFASKWMAHSPEKEMFFKKAVVITNCAGQGIKNVINDIGISLDFWGVGKRYAVKQAVFYGGSRDWEMIDVKTKSKIKKQCRSVVKKVQKPMKRPRFRIRFFFGIMKLAHKKFIYKKLKRDGEPMTKDYLYWKEQGWLDGKIPWKDNPKN